MRCVFEIEAKQFSLVGREIVLCVRVVLVDVHVQCVCFPRYALNAN